MNTISEGSASIIQRRRVFFNPKMKHLRDISALFLRALESKNAYLLDSTSATGIRGIRYAKEAGIKKVLFLDINKEAAENTRKNLERNKIKAEVVNMSIQQFANSHGAAFDFIDLDPFGSPAPYIYDLLKVSKDGTILMVTATDTAVLCGAHSSACIKSYGSKPLHNELCKEAGIRILMNFVLRNAAQFNFGIESLIAISEMHYMRIFIRLRKGAKRAVESVKETGFGVFCDNCRSFYLSRWLVPHLADKCGYCGRKVETFGPLFLGRLYDKPLLKRMLILSEEGDGDSSGLALLNDEYDTPFFYSIPRITGHVGVSSVSPELLRKALKKKGYIASATQFDPNGVKTNAALGVVIDAIKRLNRNDSRP